VVPQEIVDAANGVAHFRRRPDPWANVRRRGEDLLPGAVALVSGTRLEPGQLALTAALDRAQVWVARRPRVTLVCTGDELRAPGEPNRPGTIPESNTVAIAGLCRRAGAEVLSIVRTPDELEHATRAISSALSRSDVLVTIGGASVGDYDIARPALEAAGVAVRFHKVNIKPGKPILFGEAGATRVLGLPGNPVSAQVTFILFGIPLLRALQGDAELAMPWKVARLTEAVRQAPGRHGFFRARLDGDRVTPCANQSSGALVSMAWANALLHVPLESEGLAAGDSVRVLSFADL
jgi:molybdopterin molybdotransferase